MRRGLVISLLLLVACNPTSTPPKGPLQGLASAGPDKPIVAPENTWTWVPIPGTECANGSPTGLGINPRPDSKRLLIFLEGGGMCASGPHCDPNGQPTAMHLGGFGETDFLEVVSHADGILKRQDAANPVATASQVLIPYCTGDLHMGDNVAPYGAHHRGYANLSLFLRRLVPTFPHVEQIILAGSSAGGMGALWNWYRVQQTFAPREVVLVDDSGPFLGPPLGSFPPAPNDPWGAVKNLPAGCSQCWPDGVFAHGPFNLFSYYARVMPGRRGALIVSLQDHEMSGRYGLDGKSFAQTIIDLQRDYMRQNPDFHLYALTSTRHVWFSGAGGSLNDIRSAGVTLGKFVADAVNGDPNWRDVQP